MRIALIGFGEVGQTLAGDLAGRAAEAAAALLGYPDLAGTYQGRPLEGFRRRNCCLIYRLSPTAPAYCGDCVLGQ